MGRITLIITCILVLILVSCEKPPIVYSETPVEKPIQEQLAKEIEEPVEEIMPIQTLGEVYVSAENWDADAEIDGLEFTLRPRDLNDNMIPTDGTVKAKMWEYRCVDRDIIFEDVYCKKEDCGNNEPTENWSIGIKKDGFGYSGTKIRLEYKEYNITDDEYKKGCLEIVLVTPDGKEFTVKKDTVFLNGW